MNDNTASVADQVVLEPIVLDENGQPVQPASVENEAPGQEAAAQDAQR